MTITKPDHEHYAKLYESQKGKSQDFLKILSILLGFTFLFFFLILLPYVNLQMKETKVNHALEDLDREIGEKKTEINIYTGVNESISSIKEDIKNSPSILQDYIRKLAEFSEASQIPLEYFLNAVILIEPPTVS